MASWRAGEDRSQEAVVAGELAGDDGGLTHGQGDVAAAAEDDFVLNALEAGAVEIETNDLEQLCPALGTLKRLDELPVYDAPSVSKRAASLYGECLALVKLRRGLWGRRCIFMEGWVAVEELPGLSAIV